MIKLELPEGAYKEINGTKYVDIAGYEYAYYNDFPYTTLVFNRGGDIPGQGYSLIESFDVSTNADENGCHKITHYHRPAVKIENTVHYETADNIRKRGMRTVLLKIINTDTLTRIARANQTMI